MKSTLLTVGIPTFNGEAYLIQAIESVLTQLNESNSSDIEILISDNASTDQTELLVNKFVTAYPNIVRYHKNEVNVGFDRNVDNLFKMATGRYVEILGDDDYLENHTIDEILKVIRRDEGYGFLLLNVGFLNISTNTELAANLMESDQQFQDKDDFFKWSKWRTSAISSIIIRRMDWLSVNLDSYMGNQWIHISALLEVIAINAKAYAFSKKMITVRVGNARWSNNGNQLKLGLIHLKVISKMLQLDYKSETFQCFVDDRFNGNLKDIILLAPFNFFERIKIARLMKFFFKDRLSFWVLHLPMLFIFGYPLLVLKPVAIALKRKFK
ncbi:glycosyltransferase family 2 protein [Pedobacter sp. PWIIR3]